MLINRRNLIAITAGTLTTGIGVTACSRSSTQSDKIMQGSIIEIVSFRLVANITDKEFISAVRASNTFIQKQPGFIARRLSKTNDGLWTDHIEWATLAQARAAADNFTQEKTLAPFMMAIDPLSTHLSHNELVVTIG